MIARVWTAQTTLAGARAYGEHFRSQVLPALGKIPGYAGAMLLNRADGGAVEVTVISYWASMDAVRKFTGPDVEAAVVADEAATLLTGYDRCVRHYEVMMQDVQTASKT